MVAWPYRTASLLLHCLSSSGSSRSGRASYDQPRRAWDRRSRSRASPEIQAAHIWKFKRPIFVGQDSAGRNRARLLVERNIEMRPACFGWLLQPFPRDANAINHRKEFGQRIRPHVRHYHPAESDGHRSRCPKLRKRPPSFNPFITESALADRRREAPREIIRLTKAAHEGPASAACSRPGYDL